METEDKTGESSLASEASGNGYQKLLKELIRSSEDFVENKELRCLSECFERIFCNGLAKGTNIRRVFGVLDFLNETSAEGQRSSFNKWLLEHIQRSTLTNLLSFVFSDTEHIKTCYEPDAFIRNEGYQNALMTCVLAVESGRLNLLKSIDPELLNGTVNRRQGHRRSSSTPQMIFVPSTIFSRKSILTTTRKSRTFDFADEKVKASKLRKSASMPNLYQEMFTNTRRPRSKTISLRNQSTKLQKKVGFKSESVIEATEAMKTEDVPYFAYRDSMATLKPTTPATKHNVPVHHFVHVEDIPIHTDYRYSPNYQKSPTSSRPKAIAKTLSTFSFLDHASNASKITSNSNPSMSSSPTDIFFSAMVVPGSKIHSNSPIAKSLEHSMKKPRSSRQNLNCFLQTINSSARPKVALDRENAHFHLSEAIIATCQQLKMNKMLNEKHKLLKDAGTKKEVVTTLAIPQPTTRKPPTGPTKFIVGSVDDESDSNSSDEAPSKRTSSTSSEDINVNVPHMEWNIADDPHSAESIAMILMSKFKNEKLPSPIWMVNEAQVPQAMLPFPESFSYQVNPDDPFHLNTFIRGSKDWAPPRQQIIFTVHPVPDRRRQCLKQQNRCAGCGMKVQVQYIHTFRYCDYLGKYFCSACHRNQISSIPGRVLDKWDFSLYPVSSFAYRWLDEIWTLPLFHVGDLNPQLYEKSKPLMRARESRLQLKYIRDFVEQCRFAAKEKGFCKEIPSHWTDDVDIWSMTDFVDTKNNVFVSRIQEIIATLEEHITKNKCELCMARGFYCELCQKHDLIFPWQDKIKRCVDCGSCYHAKCFKECTKCQRLKRRKRLLKLSTHS